jgi:hypothetical protein
MWVQTKDVIFNTDKIDSLLIEESYNKESPYVIYANYSSHAKQIVAEFKTWEDADEYITFLWKELFNR